VRLPEVQASAEQAVRKLDYAHLLRFLDDRTSDHDDALAGARWHIRKSITLRRQPVIRADRSGPRSPWVMKGLPIVEVGSYVGDDLVLFGTVIGGRWEPYVDLGDPERRYNASLAIEFEPMIYQLRPDCRLKPHRSGKGLSKAEYDAWRSAVVELEPLL
jgi:hypothetical protein